MRVNSAPRRTSVQQAFRDLGTGLRLIYSNLGPMALASILWWFAAMSLVFLGPATLMLHRMARTAATGDMLSLREIGQSWRNDWAWSSIHSLGWLVGWLVILGNAQFYSVVTGSPLALSLALPFLLIWLALGLFLYPAALGNETRTFRSTLRAALAHIVVSPARTVVMWLACISITAVCLVVPILLFVWPSFLAAWGQASVLPPRPPVEPD